MYSIEVKFDDFGDVLAEMYRAVTFRPDFSGLGPAVEKIAQEEHKRARLAGLSVTEGPLPDLAPATKRHPYRGPGPRLMPFTNSRFAAALVVDVAPTEAGMRVGTSYTGVPWLKYHLPGPEHSKRLPITNVEGLQLTAVVKIDELVEAELDRQFLEAIGFLGSLGVPALGIGPTPDTFRAALGRGPKSFP